MVRTSSSMRGLDNGTWSALYSLRFVDALPGDVFGDEGEDEDVGARTADFVLDGGLVLREAPREAAADFEGFVLVLDELDSAENDYASEGERPGWRTGGVVDAFVHDGEAGARVTAQGVDFVTLAGTVEVEATGFVIPVGVERDAVGASTVARHRKDASLRGAEDGEGFFVGKLLLEPPHGAEEDLGGNVERVAHCVSPG